MKIFVYKVKSQKKPPRGKAALSIEKILFITFAITFTIMIIVQAALLNPDVRTFLAIDAGLEGSPLEVEEYLYEEGIVVLKLLNYESCHNLKVLINGDEWARFSEKELSLLVKDGDVIELDGSNFSKPVEVGIASNSSNVYLDSTDKEFKVNSTKKKLARVRIK